MEKIKEHFDPSRLASLELEGYLDTLRESKGNLLVHATRQGVRDHYGHYAHTRGLFEPHNNFKQLLKDGSLRSRFDCTVRGRGYLAAVAQELRLDQEFDSRLFGPKKDFFESVLRSINDPGGANYTYPNFTSIHFAVNAVADVSYGAETYNEVFLAFPTPMIAAHTLFAPSLGDHGYGQGSDIWVWKREGLPVDSGLIFLPAEAQVDPNTGSRYAIDELPRNIDPEKFQRKDLPLARNPVLSEEYWRRFFEGRREKNYKCVFYTGDTTEALRRWIESNEIEVSQEAHGGFPDHLVNQKDPRVRVGLDEFNRVAEQLIAEQFA